jgi:myo-inositol-1(or 4)-monophosphatase
MIDKLSFTIDLAVKTGEVLMDYFQKGNFTAKRKQDHTLVTEADIQADQMIAEAIHASFPKDDLLSEELNPFTSSTNEKNIWIVDPLDGTTNFTLGIHYWGIVIARISNGEPELSVNYFPAIGELYTALKGKGACLNHKTTHVESPDDERRLSIFSCCSRTFRKYQVTIPYKIRVFGSAAYSMCSVSKGLSKISFEAQAKIWDFAGAWLLVNEAGGATGVLNGENPFPLKPDQNYNREKFPIIAAANAEQIARARQQITSKPHSPN